MIVSIVGTGKMAEAIIAGMAADYQLEIIARDVTKAQELGKKYGVKDILDLNKGIDISEKNLLLCVKPYALETVSKQFSGKADALLSVLAGTTLKELQLIKATYYVRTMPNLAASNQESMTTLFGDSAFKEEAISICKSFGKTLWLSSEAEIDIATAVAGSGPAFIALVAEALADGAVKEGLKRDDASKLVQGLFYGFANLIEEKHPAILKDEVMSPAGTTAAGYGALEEGGVRDSFIKAIERACKRARG